MTGAEMIRALLSRIWKYNINKAEEAGYWLLVIAVPKHPADIETICDLGDRELMEDILRAYLRKRDDENQLHTIEQAAAGASAPSEDAGSEARANEPPHQACELGQAATADRASEGSADQAHEADESHHGSDALGYSFKGLTR